MPYEVTPLLANLLKETPSSSGSGDTLMGAILTGNGNFKLIEVSVVSMAPFGAISFAASRASTKDEGNGNMEEGSARAAETDDAAWLLLMPLPPLPYL